MELRAQDLRIGNWVEEPVLGLVKVHELLNSFAGLMKETTLFSINYENINPILITEEILLKCGFDLIGTSYFIKSLPIIYFSKPYVEAEHLLGKANCGDKLTSVKYLHQLQNLYFALTGQELEVNL